MMILKWIKRLSDADLAFQVIALVVLLVLAVATILIGVR